MYLSFSVLLVFLSDIDVGKFRLIIPFSTGSAYLQIGFMFNQKQRGSPYTEQA